MSDDRPIRRRRYTQKRAENMSLWVNEPLQNTIRDELARRGWTISDLARKIGSQPSLVSRWMQGQRPNTESLALVAEALALDVRKLLVLAGHMPADEDDGKDGELIPLIVMLRRIQRDGHLSEERQLMLRTLLDWMHNTKPLILSPSLPAERQAKAG